MPREIQIPETAEGAVQRLKELAAKPSSASVEWEKAAIISAFVDTEEVQAHA